MPPVGYKKQIVAEFPGTRNEIIERSGVARGTVTGWLTRMHNAEPRECHIGDWRRSEGKGGIQPIYFSGPGDDVVCKLKPYTAKQVNKRYRKKAREDGRLQLSYARQSAKRHAKKAARTQNTWMGALLALPANAKKSRQPVRAD